jgi:hypothetical protein
MLRAEFGWEGYGLYWAVVEMLTEATDYRLSLIALKGISVGLSVDSDFLDRFLRRCFELSLLREDEDGGFYSMRVLRNAKERAKRSKTARNAANKKWANKKTIEECGSNAVADHPKSSSNAIKERKGKEIKGKESKYEDIPRDLEMVTAHFKKKNIPNAVENAKMFYGHYSANGWYRGKTKIRSWKHCMSQWDFSDEAGVNFEVQGKFLVGYCAKCGEGDHYTKDETSGDSRCCKVNILKRRGVQA